MIGVDVQPEVPQAKAQSAPLLAYFMLTVFAVALCVLFYRFMLVPRFEGDQGVPAVPDIVVLLSWIFR